MKGQRTLAYIVLIIISFFCLFWFYVLFINATRSNGALKKGFTAIPGGHLIENWKNLLAGTLPVWNGMFNSIFIATCSAVLCTYFSTMTAYAIHAYNFKAKKFMFTFILAVMMIPTQVTALGFLQLLGKIGLDDSFVPLIVPSIAAPVTFFYMKQYMESNLPLELVEAARIDGANSFQIYWKIFMPILRPSLILVGVLNMITAWNDYLGPLIFLQDRSKYTLALGLAQFKGVHTMQIIPMLATSYEANDEATEYTIHLREGVSFTDGTPWNADALIANVNKWADKSLGLKRTTFLCNVLDHAEKVDDYTVKIYLTQSFGAFISNLAHPATLIMSPKQIEAGEDACAQAPVGTGQYKFVEWVAGDHMKVELNKDWWGYDADVCGGTALADADAGFKSITFKPVAESATRVSAIQAGDAQIMWSVPTESVDTLKGDSNVSVGMGDSIAVWYFFMNTQKAPFNDVKVREAMAYAIKQRGIYPGRYERLRSVATSMVEKQYSTTKEMIRIPTIRKKQKSC